MRPLTRETTDTRASKLERRVSSLERRYIEQVQDVFVDESCVPPPGSLVRPAFHQESGFPVNVGVVRFPGGVITARMYEYCSSNDDDGPIKRRGPSRNASRIMLFGSPAGNNVDNYGDAVEGWSFKPVDDFGCIPDMPYGIFWCYRCDGDGGVVHLEAQSNSALGSTDARLWINGGLRHHNANTGPLEWGETGTVDFAELGYYGIKPVGGETNYSDWPMQGLGGPGLAFATGETITVKPFADGGGGGGWFALDHLVLMPTFPLGVSDPDNLDDQEANFTSSALTAFGYVPASSPASITNPTDDGNWLPGDTVQDDQVIQIHWDPAGHFTIAGHDESDIEGIFSGVGGVHIYVLCRAYFASLPSGANTNRCGGHLTCFTGSAPLSDIFPDEYGGWCWAYAGKMPLGDSPQGSFGIMQWLDDGENFPQSTPPDAIRSSFIAYLPQAPCDIDAVAIEDPEPFVPDETVPPPAETPLELQVSWDTLSDSPEIVSWQAANPVEAQEVYDYRAGGSVPTPSTDEGVALTAQAAAWLAGDGNITTELDDSWTAWLASASYATWAAANPAEETALLDYRAGTADRPVLATEFGQGLVSETTAWYAATAPPVPPGVPPDPTWPPPGAYAALTSDFESPMNGIWRDAVVAGGAIDRFFPDPRGGGNHVARLYTAAEAAGPNPSSSGCALYVNNGEAYAAQGMRTNYQGRIYLDPGWIATRGQFNWLMEWHISDSVPQNGPGTNARSCALGVWTDFTANGSANSNPMWALQYLGGNYAAPTESSQTLAPLVLGETKFEFQFYWSVNLDGYCNVFMDDVFVKRFSGPNLFRTQSGATDLLAWGFYNYHLKWASPLSVYWDKIAVSPG